MPPSAIDQICINTIRVLAAEAVQKAKNGHPGTPMGAAPMAWTLWTRHLRHNPRNPAWPDRDRFVLSAGHASMLLYSLLSLTGYDLPLEELQHLRQWGSKTPAHPEYGHTPGVELTTGPLGAGFAMGVGFAIAERALGERFNRPGQAIVGHHTYGIVSDGDLMEGVASEAASLAGTLALGKLIYLYDSNQITIEGDTHLAFREDVAKRFEAYGWQVQQVDGEDVEAIDAAIIAAKAEAARPSLIVVRTTIGFGSPHKAGTEAAHGSALGEDEVRLTKQTLGYPEEPPFYVADEVLAEFRKAIPRGAAFERSWDHSFAAYEAADPDAAAAWRRAMSGELPANLADLLPVFESKGGEIATRVASGKTLNALAPALESLMGGSADLASSNNTHLDGSGDFLPEEQHGRNMHFGVREHAMGSIANGMAIHGGFLPYCATFLVFSDYMRPSLRLAAIMQAKTVFVFTHDSIGLGEDGPTHQPIEHLAGLRAMPGLSLFRPADANETAAAWLAALKHAGPTVIVLSRQNLPVMDDVENIRAGVGRGGYVLADAPGGQPAVILIGTGSEVAIALKAQAQLAGEGIEARVVSLPSWDVFEAQPQEYRESVLPSAVRARVAVEAASPFGWPKYTGDAGEIVALDHFGASAPYQVLYEKFGITAENVVAAAKRSMAR